MQIGARVFPCSTATGRHSYNGSGDCYECGRSAVYIFRAKQAASNARQLRRNGYGTNWPKNINCAVCRRQFTAHGTRNLTCGPECRHVRNQLDNLPPAFAELILNTNRLRRAIKSPI